jgi:hypothetical protein
MERSNEGTKAETKMVRMAAQHERSELLDVSCGRGIIDTVNDVEKKSKTAKNVRMGKNAAKSKMARERMRK